MVCIVCRPVFGLGQKQFRSCFKQLLKSNTEENGEDDEEEVQGEGDDETELVLSRADLIDKLQEFGESMDTGELIKHLTVLLQKPAGTYPFYFYFFICVLVGCSSSFFDLRLCEKTQIAFYVCFCL